MTRSVSVPPAVPAFEDLRTGGKAVVARALAAIETHKDDPAMVALLDAAWETPQGHVTGITGPPGVGKSSLINALIGLWRSRNLRVAVLAVDPSSRRTGGALLGDRTRITADPEDPDIFIRSMAARDRLGGLADITFAAMVIMRSIFDRVIVETVGVGQSETEIADLADTVLFCVQPASGDALQFMKAGIIEVPHVAVITKADMGQVAERAKSDLEGALGLVALPDDGWDVETVLASVQTGQGLEDVVAAIDRHGAWLDQNGRRARQREAQARVYLRQTIRDRFGREGLAWAERMAAESLALPRDQSPFETGRDVARRLLASWG